MACSCASLIASTARHFDERRVRKELANYRRAGPTATTLGLLSQLTPIEPPPEAILDVGSGIGALTFGMVERAVGRACRVALSRPSLAANAEEAPRRGMGRRIERVSGDFVAIAAPLP